MPDILKSIHGRNLGLASEGADNNAHKQRAQAISRGGFVSGDRGNQISLPSPSMVAFFDDFLGDVIPDQINIVEGTDSATSDAAILAGGIGGVLRFTTGDAGTGLAADLVQATMALQWQASNGDLCFQTRLKMSAITTCYVFVGFTDLVTLEGPIISAGSADTITTNATDAVGFMFDSRMATDNWWLVGVANDVDATLQDSGYAPVADDYETFRIEVSAAGKATFYRNGKQVGTQMTGAVTPGVDLTPTIAVSKTSVAASMTMDVDYWHASMARMADGDAT
jgi:hypothetical protein